MSRFDEMAREQLAHVLVGSDFPGLGLPARDGVLDEYPLDEHVLTIVTDRAGDRATSLVAVPFKGEVIARLALWWLERFREDGRVNPVERVVDAQALVVRRTALGFSRVTAFAALTGRLADEYGRGGRAFGEARLPDGLKPGAPLPEEVVVSWAPAPDSTVAKGVVIARDLFGRGRLWARDRGADLVEAAYDFGVAADREPIIPALLHAPHQCRYRLLEPAGDVGERPTEAPSVADRLAWSAGYLELASRFIDDFSPHIGPVKNRLAYSLSALGLLA